MPNFSGGFTSDCTTGPGLNLWNRMNLNWATSKVAKGFAGTGIVTTASWPNSYDQSITIAPRNHPELNNQRGIYVPAHQQYGYTVELVTADGWETGVAPSPVLLIHRVYFGNQRPYLVTTTGGTQSDFTHPFTENNEGTLSIGLTAIQGTPPRATVHVSYTPGPAIWWNPNFGFDMSPPSIGDWSPGNYKGQCALGQGITGVSRFTNALQSHAIQCGPRNIGTNPSGSQCYTRVFNANGNQGTTDNGWDWDPGSYKGECGLNEYAAGLAQDAGGGLNTILCCPGNVGHNSCDVQVFYNNSSPGFHGTDWDGGFYKGQCPDGQYVAGASTPAFTSVGNIGAAHAVLCCSP